MARRSDTEMLVAYRAWKERLTDPEFLTLPHAKQASEFGVSDQTVSNWLKAITKEEWSEILEQSEKNIAKPAAQLNSVLFRTAMEGDVAAMKLWKESIQGWSPKVINDNLNRNADLEGKTDAELMAELLKGVSKEQLEAALKEKELKVVNPNGEGISEQKESAEG